MIHRGARFEPRRTKDQKDGKGRSHSNQGDENNGRSGPPGQRNVFDMMIAKSTNGWLNHKGKKSTHPVIQDPTCVTDLRENLIYAIQARTG